jgi:hypothetical protein
VLAGLVDRVLRHRRRFPRALNRAIDYVADHPGGFLGRLVARRMGLPEPGPAIVLTAPAAPIRVLIGPVNYSGQGRLWATSLERSDSRIAARNVALDVPGGFSFPADLVVPVPVYHNSRQWQAEQLRAIRGFSHVLVEAEEPLLGRMFQRDVAAEVAQFTAAGLSVAFISHGTDIRLPSRHITTTRWSPYLDRDMYVDRLERLAVAHRDILLKSGRPLFASTPDLLADLPEATWCPVVVDPATWKAAELSPAEPTRPLRVVHVPSSALIKGTHLIEPVLRGLHERGVIDYRPITGVPAARMPEMYREADVVLDQFRLGSYGVAACEAMAAGRTVIGHVIPSVRDYVANATGLQLPIVEATVDTLESIIRSLYDDRARLRECGVSGRHFVNEVHDGRMSSRALIDQWIGKA